MTRAALVFGGGRVGEDMSALATSGLSLCSSGLSFGFIFAITGTARERTCTCRRNLRVIRDKLHMMLIKDQAPLQPVTK